VGLVCHNVRTYNRWAGEHLFEGSRLQLALERWMYRVLDLVFVHGEVSREEFERTWPVTRLETIPHGDERLFAAQPPPPAAEPRALFFGEWRKVKGLPLLMEAWDLLAARDPDARLTVAGAPDPGDTDIDAVRDWAARHDGRVELIEGYVPVDEVAAIFARARVVVAPYTVAYQSGVVHLAQTLGRAVVATDVGDLRDAVQDGRTGRLVAPGDAAALAAALGELLRDAGAAESMGSAGRARVGAEASWELVGERAAAALAPLTGR
jgi:glycosyltransferase involved in cell wall biosynthesis